MIDLQNRHYCPTLDEIGEFIGNQVFADFCSEISSKYGCREKIEFSSCSLEPGWNVKFKKSGRSLCTIYPRNGFFTVMVVVGRKEKEAAEAILPVCCLPLREIYRETKEVNGQRWLMLDLEDREQMYEDVFRLLDIRIGK